MIGTHGIGGFRKLLLGSVTAKVLHDCNLPVLTGAHLESACAAPASYRHIACGVDLDDEGERTLRAAWELAQQLGAQFSVIHACPQPHFGSEPSSEIQREWHASVVEASREGVTELVNKVGCGGDIHVAEGHSTRYVTETARKIGVDLLVIGRGEASKSPSRLPSHTYGIIRESSCPILSV